MILITKWFDITVTEYESVVSSLFFVAYLTEVFKKFYIYKIVSKKRYYISRKNYKWEQHTGIYMVSLYRFSIGILDCVTIQMANQ